MFRGIYKKMLIELNYNRGVIVIDKTHRDETVLILVLNATEQEIIANTQTKNDSVFIFRGDTSTHSKWVIISGGIPPYELNDINDVVDYLTLPIKLEHPIEFSKTQTFTNSQGEFVKVYHTIQIKYIYDYFGMIAGFLTEKMFL